jgi:hypothetical protein
LSGLLLSIEITSKVITLKIIASKVIKLKIIMSKVIRSKIIIVKDNNVDGEKAEKNIIKKSFSSERRQIRIDATLFTQNNSRRYYFRSYIFDLIFSTLKFSMFYDLFSLHSYKKWVKYPRGFNARTTAVTFCRNIFLIFFLPIFFNTLPISKGFVCPFVLQTENLDSICLF